MASHSITTDRYRFNYYFGDYPNFIIESADVDFERGEEIIVSLPDLLKALETYPDAYIVTHRLHLTNDACIGPEIRDYLLNELHRVDSEDDLRIMVFRR